MTAPTKRRKMNLRFPKPPHSVRTVLMFAIGIYPQFVLNIFNSTVVQMARLLG